MTDVLPSVSLPTSGTRNWKLWDEEHPWVKKLRPKKGESPADYDKDLQSQLFGDDKLHITPSVSHLPARPLNDIISTLHPAPAGGKQDEDKTDHYLATDLHGDEIAPWGKKTSASRYGVVTFDDQGRVLLREPTNHFDGYAWTFPKGHPDKGEHPLTSAMRETLEETGHQPAIVGHIPGGFSGSATGSKQHFYLGHDTKGLVDGTAMAENGETEHLKWADPKEALNSISQSDNLQGRYRDLQTLKAAYESYGQMHPEHNFPAIVLPPPPPKPPKWHKPAVFNPDDPEPRAIPSHSYPKPKHGSGQTTISQELGTKTNDPWGEIQAKALAKMKAKKRDDMVMVETGPELVITDLKFRNWATWDAEHPYARHPRPKKGESAKDFDARIQAQFKGARGPLSGDEFKKLATKHGIRGTRVTTYNNAATKHFSEAVLGPKSNDEAALRSEAAKHRRLAAKAKTAGNFHDQTVHLAASHAYTHAAKVVRGPAPKPSSISPAKAAKVSDTQVHKIAKEAGASIDKAADAHLLTEEEAGHLHQEVSDLELKIAHEKHKEAKISFIIKLGEVAAAVALTAATGGLALPVLIGLLAVMSPAIGNEATHLVIAHKKHKATIAALAGARSIDYGLETRDWAKWDAAHPHGSSDDAFKAGTNEALHALPGTTQFYREAQAAKHEASARKAAAKGNLTRAAFHAGKGHAFRQNAVVTTGSGGPASSYKGLAKGPAQAKALLGLFEHMRSNVIFGASFPELETRNWTEWNLEHPYIKKGWHHNLSSEDYDKTLQQGFKGWVAKSQSEFNTVAGKHSIPTDSDAHLMTYNEAAARAYAAATQSGLSAQKLKWAATNKGTAPAKKSKASGLTMDTAEHIGTAHGYAQAAKEAKAAEKAGIYPGGSGGGGVAVPSVSAPVKPVATAQVVIKPDLTQFTKDLQAATDKVLGATSSDGMPHTAGDFDQAVKIDGPTGSNPAQWYQMPDGSKVILKKAKDKAHAENEVAVNETYKAAGIPVPETSVVKMGSTYAVASKKVEDLSPWNSTSMKGMAQKNARKGFGIDALTSNYDALGLVDDNAMLTKDGQVVRIDNGGGGFFRAQGAVKNSFKVGKWDEDPSGADYHTLRDPSLSEQGQKLYGAPEGTHDDEMQASLKQARDLDLTKVGKAMEAKGISPEFTAKYLGVLQDRQKHLAGILPDETPKAVPSVSPTQEQAAHAAGLEAGNAMMANGATPKDLHNAADTTWANNIPYGVGVHDAATAMEQSSIFKGAHDKFDDPDFVQGMTSAEADKFAVNWKAEAAKTDSKYSPATALGHAQGYQELAEKLHTQEANTSDITEQGHAAGVSQAKSMAYHSNKADIIDAANAQQDDTVFGKGYKQGMIDHANTLPDDATTAKDVGIGDHVSFQSPLTGDQVQGHVTDTYTTKNGKTLLELDNGDDHILPPGHPVTPVTETSEPQEASPDHPITMAAADLKAGDLYLAKGYDPKTETPNEVGSVSPTEDGYGAMVTLKDGSVGGFNSEVQLVGHAAAPKSDVPTSADELAQTHWQNEAGDKMSFGTVSGSIYPAGYKSGGTTFPSSVNFGQGLQKLQTEKGWTKVGTAPTHAEAFPEDKPASIGPKPTKKVTSVMTKNLHEGDIIVNPHGGYIKVGKHFPTGAAPGIISGEGLDENGVHLTDLASLPAHNGQMKVQKLTSLHPVAKAKAGFDATEANGGVNPAPDISQVLAEHVHKPREHATLDEMEDAASSYSGSGSNNVQLEPSKFSEKTAYAAGYAYGMAQPNVQTSKLLPMYVKSYNQHITAGEFAKAANHLGIVHALQAKAESADPGPDLTKPTKSFEPSATFDTQAEQDAYTEGVKTVDNIFTNGNMESVLTQAYGANKQGNATTLTQHLQGAVAKFQAEKAQTTYPTSKAQAQGKIDALLAYGAIDPTGQKTVGDLKKGDDLGQGVKVKSIAKSTKTATYNFDAGVKKVTTVSPEGTSVMDYEVGFPASKIAEQHLKTAAPAVPALKPFPKSEAVSYDAAGISDQQLARIEGEEEFKPYSTKKAPYVQGYLAGKAEGAGKTTSELSDQMTALDNQYDAAPVDSDEEGYSLGKSHGLQHAATQTDNGGPKAVPSTSAPTKGKNTKASVMTKNLKPTDQILSPNGTHFTVQKITTTPTPGHTKVWLLPDGVGAAGPATPVDYESAKKVTKLNPGHPQYVASPSASGALPTTASGVAGQAVPGFSGPVAIHGTAVVDPVTGKVKVIAPKKAGFAAPPPPPGKAKEPPTPTATEHGVTLAPIVHDESPTGVIDAPGYSVKHGKLADLSQAQKEGYDKAYVVGYNQAVDAINGGSTPSDVYATAQAHNTKVLELPASSVEGSEHAGVAKGAHQAAFEAQNGVAMEKKAPGFKPAGGNASALSKTPYIPSSSDEQEVGTASNPIQQKFKSAISTWVSSYRMKQQGPADWLDELNKSAAGQPLTPIGTASAGRVQAQNILTGAEKYAKAQSKMIYRGMSMDSSLWQHLFGQYQPGDEIVVPLQSFSHNYPPPDFGSGSIKVIVHLQKGAQAWDITHSGGLGGEAELLSGGTMEIQKIETKGGIRHVYVKQNGWYAV